MRVAQVGGQALIHRYKAVVQLPEACGCVSGVSSRRKKTMPRNTQLAARSVALHTTAAGRKVPRASPWVRSTAHIYI